jgi:hypothetical protein
MELEAEVARLRAEIEMVRRQAVEEVQRTHRQYRRDLVPVRNLPDLFVSAPQKQHKQRSNHGA